MVDSESELKWGGVGVGFSRLGLAGTPMNWYTPPSEDVTGCSGRSEGCSRLETAEVDMTLGSRHTEVGEATSAIEAKKTKM